MVGMEKQILYVCPSLSMVEEKLTQSREAIYIVHSFCGPGGCYHENFRNS